jgi:chemotaxis protein MotB
VPQRAFGQPGHGGLIVKAAQQPIIVIRRKKQAHAHHGGAWKVAYADFVTAMMAFFLVMWLAAQDSTIRTAIAGYFQEPGLLPHEQSNGIVASGQGGIDNAGMPTVIPRKAQGMLEAEQRALVTAAEHIKQHMAQFGGGGPLKGQVEITITDEGLRIELVDRSQSSFFDTGSSVLAGDSEKILIAIGTEVGKLANTVVVEGHTDSAAYQHGQTYDNWNLSTDRANVARRVLVQSGVRPDQLKGIRGYADTALRYQDQPLDPRNRRVSIVVKSQSAEAGTK